MLERKTIRGNKMKISKRQLRNIIKEEYSKLKRQGLIKESYFKGRHIELQNEILQYAQNQAGQIVVYEAGDMIGEDYDVTLQIMLDMVDGGLLMLSSDHEQKMRYEAPDNVGFRVHPDYM